MEYKRLGLWMAIALLSGTAPVAAQPIVELDSPVGIPGGQVVVTARLRANGSAVAAMQNDTQFDVVNISIPAKPNSSAPDCAANPAIDKNATSFGFQPFPCSGSDCTKVRAVVLATDNVDAIDDGAVLYTCKVNISPQAQVGPYPLQVSGVVMSDPDANAIADADGTDGVVVVAAATPTFTATVTATETPTPTFTVTNTATLVPTSTPTSTLTPVPSATATVVVPIFTVTPTVTPVPPACPSDCNRDGEVTIDEIIRGINIALGNAPLSDCSAADVDGDGEVTINELISAVNAALLGC